MRQAPGFNKCLSPASSLSGPRLQTRLLGRGLESLGVNQLQMCIIYHPAVCTSVFCKTVTIETLENTITYPRRVLKSQHKLNKFYSAIN